VWKIWVWGWSKDFEDRGSLNFFFLGVRFVILDTGGSGSRRSRYAFLPRSLGFSSVGLGL
jgi:hypothetical protein